jgi:hypothetical protein
MPQAYETLLSPEQLVELEQDLIAILREQGMHISEIKLIGLKGSGDFSSAFAVQINGVHHVLKVYRLEESFRREIKNLRRQIPKDRFLFVWPAKRNRFNYYVVIIEVPDGLQLHERMLTPLVAERFGDALIKLHSLQYKKKRVSVKDLYSLFDEAERDAIAHGDLFAEIGSARVQNALQAGRSYLKRHEQTFRVPKSRTHNDLWWANVIVAEEDVYLIDWENLGRDDYAKDLAFFRVMANYERTAATVSMWDSDPGAPIIDTFMQPILERYPREFGDQNFWQRYGLYSLLMGCLIFSRAYYGDRRGAAQAARIVTAGLHMFENHCLLTEAAE